MVRKRSGGTLPGVAPANAYPTADGSEVLIAGNGDPVFRRLCRRPWAIPSWPTTTASPPTRPAAPTPPSSTASSAEWTGDLRVARRCWTGSPSTACRPAAVYTAPDMVADEHYAARDMVLRAHGPGRVRACR